MDKYVKQHETSRHDPVSHDFANMPTSPRTRSIYNMMIDAHSPCLYSLTLYNTPTQKYIYSASTPPKSSMTGTILVSKSHSGTNNYILI